MYYTLTAYTPIHFHTHTTTCTTIKCFLTYLLRIQQQVIKYTYTHLLYACTICMHIPHTPPHPPPHTPLSNILSDLTKSSQTSNYTHTHYTNTCTPLPHFTHTRTTTTPPHTQLSNIFLTPTNRVQQQEHTRHMNTLLQAPTPLLTKTTDNVSILAQTQHKSNIHPPTLTPPLPTHCNFHLLHIKAMFS